MAENNAVSASEISRFSVDGVIAEMIIEVDNDSDSETLSAQSEGMNDRENSNLPLSFLDFQEKDDSAHIFGKNVSSAKNSSEKSGEVRGIFETSTFATDGNLIPIQIKQEAIDPEVSSDIICLPEDTTFDNTDSPASVEENIRPKKQVKAVRLLKEAGRRAHRKSPRENTGFETKVLKGRKTYKTIEEERFPTRMSTRNKFKETAPSSEKVAEPSSKVSLRKLPLRKSTSSVNESKDPPKVIWENGVGPGVGLKLGSITDICDRIRGMRKHGLRPLYRILYFRWPPNDINDVIYQVLQFSGFPFNETSYEYLKRKSVMKLLVDSTLVHVCFVLGIKPGTKNEMIDNVMNFLMKPTKTLNPLVDNSLQPFVPLVRIDFDPHLKTGKKQEESKVKSVQLFNARSKSNESKNKSEVSKTSKNVANEKLPLFQENAPRTKSSKETKKSVTTESQASKQKRRLSKKLAPLKRIISDTDLENSEKGEIYPDKKVKKTQSSDWIQSTLLSELQYVDKEVMDTTDDDSLVPPDKPSIEKLESTTRKGDRLESFPQIKKSVSSANHSVLQRLHVLLYGSSDQPENLQKNILNFDGFSFSAWADEWDQKKFLLSLLSMNMLREYVEILHLANADDSPSTLIDNLMRFLTTPNKLLLAGNTPDDDNVARVKVKRTSPKQNAKAKLVKIEKKATPGKKIQKKKTTEKSKRKKYLMDDDQVKKLELEIAREQRARRRSSLQDTRYRMNVKYHQTAVSNYQPAVPSLALRDDYTSSSSNPFPALYPSPVLSSPSGRLKLEYNPHVKFMVVTLNYPDLEILHHLLFLRESNKSKIRRNILEFDGFPFDARSVKYKMRIMILNRLSYAIVKRLAFILGLTSHTTKASHNELNNLIMQFLMTPNKIKQVPIKEFPHNFFQDYPKEFPGKEIFSDWSKISEEQTVSSTTPSNIGSPVAKSCFATQVRKTPIVKHLDFGKIVSRKKNSNFQHMSEMSDNSFFTADSSSGGIPIAEVITCDPVKIKNTEPKDILPDTSESGEKEVKTIGNLKFPQIMAPKIVLPAVQKDTAKTVTNLPTKMVLLNQPSSVCTVQKFVFQKNGQNRTLQFIKIPPGHPLASVLNTGNTLQSSAPGISAPPAVISKTTPISTIIPPVQIPKIVSPVKIPNIVSPVKIPKIVSPVRNIVLQPNLSIASQPRPTVLQLKCDARQIQNQTVNTVLPSPNTFIASDIRESIASSDNEEYILSDNIPKPVPESISLISSDEEMDEAPLVNMLGHPSDEVLVAKTQEIILSSRLENITMRKVIEKITLAYPKFDLEYRHEFIKTAVKNIICGITSSGVS